VLRTLCPGALCIAAALLVFETKSDAAAITLTPVADATLIEYIPSNSMGGVDYFTAGTTQNGPRNRGLLQFDVASAIPRGSKITSASLGVTVTKQSGEKPAAMYCGLHRMLRSWGEGTNLPTVGPGLGSPAADGDATWLCSFSYTNEWAAPGGLENTDYIATASSNQTIDNVGGFSFDASFDIVADVQLWLDHPELNFGWMLRSEDESVRFSSRHFASREYADPFSVPQLNIEFLPPPILSVPHVDGAQLEFSFDADAGGIYSVDYAAVLANPGGWLTLTNFGYVAVPTTLTARDSVTNLQRFYRVRVQ